MQKNIFESFSQEIGWRPRAYRGVPVGPTWPAPMIRNWSCEQPGAIQLQLVCQLFFFEKTHKLYSFEITITSFRIDQLNLRQCTKHQYAFSWIHTGTAFPFHILHRAFGSDSEMGRVAVMLPRNWSALSACHRLLQLRIRQAGELTAALANRSLSFLIIW